MKLYLNQTFLYFKLKHTVLKKETYYFCQFFEYPKYQTDVHLIRFEILNDQKDRDLLHHIGEFILFKLPCKAISWLLNTVRP